MASTNTPTTFTGNRFRWERLVLASDLPPAARFVALVLATYVNADDEAWPAVATLAKGAGVDSRTVQRHLKTLERHGLLARRVRGGHLASVYTLILPAPAREEDDTPARGDMGATPTNHDAIVRGDIGVTSTGPDAKARGDMGVTPGVTLVSRRGDMGVTQTLQLTHNQTPPSETIESDIPPEGVSDVDWITARTVLGHAISQLGDDGKRLREDWTSLGAKAKLCHEITSLLGFGKSQRAIVDVMAEGGYRGVDHPAQALYTRVHRYRCQILPPSDERPRSGKANISVLDAVAKISAARDMAAVR